MSIQQLRKVCFATCVFAVALFAADSPFVGTWKMNAAKSKLDGSGIGTGATLVIEPDGGGLKVSVDGTDAKGQPMKFNYSATLDGKPATITGSPMTDTVMLTKVSDNVINAVGKKDNKVVYNDHRTISKDGKTMTIARTGTNAEGKKFKATLVFDKQ
jgi:hypothetical protein